MKSPTISVLISSYNYEQYVVEAVESALLQTPPVLEVLVVDDGSKDQSVKVLNARYSGHDRVRVISKENGGQLSAWVAGAAQIRGDIVALMDSDDYWKPGYIDRILREYVRDPSLDFIYSEMQLLGTRNGLMHGDSKDRDLGISILMGAFIQRWQGSATSALSLRTPLFRRLIDLPRDMVLEWKSRPDDCLVCGADVLGAHKYYIGEALVVHREHDSNALQTFKKTAPANMKYVVRYEHMLDHYRNLMGITPRWQRMAKYEFRTKSSPTFTELLEYCRLVTDPTMGAWKRLEHKAAMLAHYLNSRWGRP